MSIQHTTFSGLVFDRNPHGTSAAPGSMTVANNVVFRRPGVIDPRPGFSASVERTHITANEPLQLIYAFGDILGIGTVQNNWFAGYTGNLQNPSGNALRAPSAEYASSAAQLRGNLYIPTDEQVAKFVDASGADPVWAGVPAIGYMEQYTIGASATASKNWLPNTHYVGYRALLRRTDANGLVARGRPSPKIAVYNNTGVTSWVSFYVPLPPGAKTGDVLELYRTPTSTVSALPESYSKVGEVKITGTLVALGYAYWADQTSIEDSYAGQALYSQPTQGGAAYWPPPDANVLGTFNGHMLAANIRGRQSMTLRQRYAPVHGMALSTQGEVGTRVGTGNLGASSTTISSLSSTAGLRVGMIVKHANFRSGAGAIVVGILSGTAVQVDVASSGAATGTSLTFYDTLKVTDGAVTEYFPLHSARSFSLAVAGAGLVPIPWGPYTGPSQLIELTHAQDSLPDAVTTTLPKIDCVVSSIDPDRTLFWSTTNAEMYDPALPESSGSAIELDAVDEPGRLDWSVKDKPESFVRNRDSATIGDGQSSIRAIVDGDRLCYIFTDAGIYIGTQSGGGLRFDLLSHGYRLMSNRHVCSIPGGAAAWTDQGMIVIRGQQITNVSETRIDTLFRPYASSDNESGNMAYNPDGQEICMSISSAMSLVYNMVTGCWSTWEILGVPVKLFVRTSGTDQISLFSTAEGAQIHAQNPYALLSMYPRLETADGAASTGSAAQTAVLGQQVRVNWTGPGTHTRFVRSGDILESSGGRLAVVESRVSVGPSFNQADVWIRPLDGVLDWDGESSTLYYAVPYTCTFQSQHAPDLSQWSRVGSVQWAIHRPAYLGDFFLSLTSSNSDTSQGLYISADESYQSETFRMLPNATHACAYEIYPTMTMSWAGAIWSIVGLTIVSRAESRRRFR